MKKKLLIVLVGVGLALLAGSVVAQSDGEISFGIRPTKAFEDRPETFSYFSHELAPGAVLSDEALVMNNGDVPVALKLYAADGITAMNTGTAFAQQGQESTGASRGVSRWLSLSVTEIALGPGEERVVPFTITVPSNTSPGHHVAGLVLTAPPSGEASPSGEGEGQFAADVIQQAGVAVVIDVPGPHVAGLEITGSCLKEQNDLGATFEIDVRNTGNVFVKGEGSHVVTDRNGAELASTPITMGTVLPGDATTFQFTHPVHLADADYLLAAVLNYDGQVAVFEGAAAKVKDGQPEVGCESEEEGTFPPGSIPDIGATPFGGVPPFGWYAGFAAAFLALAIALARQLSLLCRRKESAQ